MTSKTKVYELAKELGQDSQHMVEVIQRLGIDIKNPMSVLGTEEVRTVRDYYRRQKPAAGKSAPVPKSVTPVTEKRVGATVIRRRVKATEPIRADAEEAIESAASESTAEVFEEELAPSAASAASEEETQVFEETAQPEAEPTETEAVALPPSSGTVEAVAPKTEKPALPEKKRRIYPSIIKKVATEQYLGEKVGPKPPTPTKKEESPKTVTPARPGTATGAAADDKSKTAVLGGPRRVREIELVTPEVARDSKRRVMERQSTVFKSADYLKRELVHSTKKKKTVINRPALKTEITKPAEHKRIIEMGTHITVSGLAKEMGVKATNLIAKLMNNGVTAAINDRIDHDTAALMAHEFGYEVKQKVFREEDFLPTVDPAAAGSQPRPPVVTIMGHVDHGKTSLLDYIRKAKVAAGEAGGITQHVGAYTVQVPKGSITFIDTPGHEAFTAMRARGAKVTDIVILVVSAVDGVMPQTLESVSHAKAGSVPILVAVNKIDLPDANPDRIKQTLAGHGLNPEEWGGDTIYANVSAKTGKGVDQLLESILLQAEVLELKANYDVPGRGTVIESRLDKSKGPVATVLVQHGKLRFGDVLVTGASFGKVRAMVDSQGKKLTEATPGMPVEILGLPIVPNVGDTVSAVDDEKQAKEVVSGREISSRPQIVESKPKLTLDEILAQNPKDGQELKVILKADVQGSAEALRDALQKLPQDKVRLKLLHFGTGGVTESDVMLAAASDAVVVGFNVRPDVKAQKLAAAENVSIRTFNIIYELLDEVKKRLEGLLAVEHREKVIGRAEVRNVFHIPKIGAIAGSAVVDGKVMRGCFLRLLRDSRIVYEGKISSLKRFKEDVREVASGFECGIGLENFNDLKMGDQFEAFIKEEVKGTL